MVKAGLVSMLIVATVCVLSVVLVAGCGASASTNPVEAKAASSAERIFDVESSHAYKVAVAHCKTKNRSAECRQPADPLLETRARVRFTRAIEDLLHAGVGPKCAEALEEALSTMNSVPQFPGSIASACRAESQE